MGRSPNFDQIIEWWEGSESLLLRLARSFFGAEDRARDLVQEVAVAALLRPVLFVDREHFGAWARLKLRSLALDMIRRAKREREVLAGRGRERFVPEEAGPDGTDIVAELNRALAELPERRREIARSYFLDGRSIREIAGEYGIEEATVRSHIRHSRPVLAKRLGS